jgi:hypothetical protein
VGTLSGALVWGRSGTGSLLIVKYGRFDRDFGTVVGHQPGQTGAESPKIAGCSYMSIPLLTFPHDFLPH